MDTATGYVAPIVLAVIAALSLAIGTHLQHRAVATGGVTRGRGLNWLSGLLCQPLWLVGLGLLATETVLNVLALGLGPVALVQPIGILSLVTAIVISAVMLQRRVTPALTGCIALTMVSVGSFIAVSARHSQPLQADPVDAKVLSWILVAITVVGSGIAASRVGHLFRVMTAGVLFGAVATGAHVLANTALGDSTFTLTHALLGAGVIAGSAAGIWIVQTAYATGPPETVLAGLTVIDPLTAVALGTGLLGEYAQPDRLGLAVLLASGLAAILGVVLLARFHPAATGHQCSAESAESVETAGVTGSSETCGALPVRTGPDTADERRLS